VNPIHRACGRSVGLAACVLGVALLVSCKQTSRAAALKTQASASASPRNKPKTSRQLATTSEAIYLGNLEGDVEAYTARVKKHPDSAEDFASLSAALYTRGRFRGSSGEVADAVEQAGAAARLLPRDPKYLLLRAEEEQSLHRFAAARADLEKAKALNADPERVASIAMGLDWNEGRYDIAIPAIRKARLDHPSRTTWAREAALEHDLGRELEADLAYEKAEDRAEDPDPLVLAHLNVQRGVQKMETGHLPEAVAFFREAVARMPSYVAANEHLAEALVATGADSEATHLYETIVERSDDPEFAYALARRYAARGESDKANRLTAQARSRYEEWLKTYPEAMYWHASEFFLAVGDVRQAVELLEKNVKLRPNSVSYTALARAQLADGRWQDAKVAIDRALAMPVVSALLFWTAARVYARAGDSERAAEYRRRAERINARIASDEPPIL
jgi:tetratricopeptide (TPR) repeat protein